MSPSPAPETHEGVCACGLIRYRLTGPPLFVHCCHCRACQRESGAAFAVNAMYESDRVHLLPRPSTDNSTSTTATAELDTHDLPTQSGRPQRLSRCPSCKIVLWSLYGDNSDYVRFIRVGTLAEPGVMPPDAHIFVGRKAPWVVLPEGARVFDEFYDREEAWPEETKQRMAQVAEKKRRDREPVKGMEGAKI